MANEVEICNLAISRLAANPIQALSDQTREAQVCRRHFNILRDSVLRDFDWAFARRRVAVARLDLTDSVFTFVYDLPADCLIVRRIVNPSDPEGTDPAKKINFEVALHPTDNRQVLYTNQASPTIVYTANVTGPTVFDAMFTDALAWRLAMEFAVPLRGSPELMNACSQYYRAALASSHVQSAKESHQVPTGAGDFVAARQ